MVRLDDCVTEPYVATLTKHGTRVQFERGTLNIVGNLSALASRGALRIGVNGGSGVVNLTSAGGFYTHGVGAEESVGYGPGSVGNTLPT